jgi:hypothetical protein
MLILIEVQATDNIVHSPLHICLETDLKNVKKLKKGRNNFNGTITFILPLPIVSEKLPLMIQYCINLLQSVLNFAIFSPTYLHSSCLKLSFKNRMKKFPRFHL